MGLTVADLNAIRSALAVVLTSAGAGWTAYPYVPEDVRAFPAAVVGSPREVQYGASLRLVRFLIPVTLAV